MVEKEENKCWLQRGGGAGKARCTICAKDIDISNMGYSALKRTILKVQSIRNSVLSLMNVFKTFRIHKYAYNNRKKDVQLFVDLGMEY